MQKDSNEMHISLDKLLFQWTEVTCINTGKFLCTLQMRKQKTVANATAGFYKCYLLK
jgi:hypothetical protein